MQLDLDELLKDINRMERVQADQKPHASLKGGTPGVSVGKAPEKSNKDN